jgi:phage terminase small subunit
MVFLSMEPTLSPQRRLFCESYASSLSATDAAVAAGYSAATAAQQGSRLLKNVQVKEFVNKLLKEKTDSIKLTRESLLAELATLALGPGRDAVKLGAIKLAAELIGLKDGSENDGGGKESRSDAVDAVLGIGEEAS